MVSVWLLLRVSPGRKSSADTALQASVALTVTVPPTCAVVGEKLTETLAALALPAPLQGPQETL